MQRNFYVPKSRCSENSSSSSRPGITWKTKLLFVRERTEHVSKWRRTGDGKTAEADGDCETRDSCGCVVRESNTEQKQRLQPKSFHTTANRSCSQKTRGHWVQRITFAAETDATLRREVAAGRTDRHTDRQIHRR